jgi:hypothetical protein
MTSDLSVAPAEDLTEVDSFLEELCSFLACLMHSRVTAIHLPALNVVWTAGNESKLQALVEVIGAECFGLKALAVENALNHEPPPLTEGSSMGGTLFGTLPQLAHLQIVQLDGFYCDDWALQQFGMHGQCLEYVD